MENREINKDELADINKAARDYVKTLPAINYRSAYDFGTQNITAFTKGYLKCREQNKQLLDEIERLKSELKDKQESNKIWERDYNDLHSRLIKYSEELKDNERVNEGFKDAIKNSMQIVDLWCPNLTAEQIKECHIGEFAALANMRQRFEILLNNEQITKIVDLTLIQQNAVWSVIQYISKMQSKNLNFIIKRDTVMDMIKNELI